QGQYKIVDLRVGTYSITFTLAGFSTVKRGGLELTTNFTATVNAELKVGSLEETLTVSGQTPVVDVQNVLQQRVITTAVLENLPNAKSIQSMGALIPGVTNGSVAGGQAAHDVGGTSADAPVGVAIHGGRPTDQHIFYDSMRTNNIQGTGGGANQSMWANPAAVQEISMAVGNLPPETETGGVRINVIPKEGGNTFTGFFFANGANHSSDNLTHDLRARGFDAVSRVKGIFDVNGALGGRIVKDKLWFYTAHRRWGNENYVGGRYFAVDPLAWTHTDDLSRPAYEQNLLRSNNARLTWQVDQKNKLNLAAERQDQCLCYSGIQANASPEGVTHTH